MKHLKTYENYEYQINEGFVVYNTKEEAKKIEVKRKDKIFGQ
jgi:hypothetical protein